LYVTHIDFKQLINPQDDKPREIFRVSVFPRQETAAKKFWQQKAPQD
jgi:hypothetical protein